MKTLRPFALLLALASTAAIARAQTTTQPTDLPWPEANAIVAGIAVPTFPDAKFSVMDYGATADGQTDCTDAFNKAIASASAAGGGHVIVPAGTYVTGAIELLSNVDLHLDGATINFTSDVTRYPMSITRYQGIDLMNTSPLIHAVDQTNVAVTGSGILDGAATAGWNKDGKGNFALLGKMAASATPISQRRFGHDRPLRTTLLEPYHCTNVLIQGITIRHSHFWQMHPCLCRNVTVDGVTTESTTSQTDGCDPESCQNVVIKNCLLGAGDDCIAIKAGRNPDPARIHQPCSNIVVMNDRFHGPWGMITCGSEQTEGVEHVYAYNLSTDNDFEDVRHHTGVDLLLYMKTSVARGGFIRDVHIDHVTGKFNKAIVSATLRYGGTKTEAGADVPGATLPDVSNISISHVTDASTPVVFDVTGLENDPIRDFQFSDCSFTNVTRKGNVKFAAINLENVSINGQVIDSADAN